ncbi:hypothetical protein AAG906_016216 [Vitis piasezkii]
MASTGPSQSLKRPDSSLTRGDQLIITPLGAGNEVGRSCVYMSYKGKTILFDCGIHPAYSGMAALPYFDEIDPSTIDVLLVTHFHLDHAASLPYFLEKTTFKGRVFMTHATKAIYKLLLSDYVKVSKVSVEDMLYDEQDILRSMDKIEVIDFHQTLEVNGIRFWCYTAGHVLGAAMFMVDIAGVRVLYTGDYSRRRSSSLCSSACARKALHRCHPLNHFSRGNSSLSLMSIGLTILSSITSPYIMLPLAKRCMAVYQTYINFMNERICNQFANSNPFDFKHISPLKSIENFNDVGPSVVMASLSGLPSGLSRQLFDMWCSLIRKMHVLYLGMSWKDIGKTIINEPKEVTLMNGLTAPSTCRSITFLSLPMQILHRQWFLVKKGFTYQIMAPDDLNVFSQLSTANVTQRITIPYTGAFGVIKHRLKQIYEIHERATVKHESEKHISLHWTSDPISDMVSDSIVALVLNIRGHKTEEENGKKAEKVINTRLVSLFGDVKLGENGNLVISVDGNVGENKGLKERVRVVFQWIQNAVKPILYLCLSSLPQVLCIFNFFLINSEF